MATLILTAVGSALGGPIGGAIGAIAGQAIDGELFRPAARQGPRLASLIVQTSSYGAQIPKIFGTMRVAGTVAWATDLIESKTTSGGGKGRAATETYSYSASFAVLLSARPILRVGRIWADGKLLRGDAGDLKVELGALRVHDGNDDQAVDPLIASAEGGRAPAWRGTTYAVFEHLQLVAYGNRIPSLSFEVIADAAPVGVGTMLTELADVTSEGGPELAGFAASGTSLRNLVESLETAFPMICRDEDGARIRFSPVAGTMVEDADLGASVDGQRVARITCDVAPLETTAAAISIAYGDPGRDFQAGLQRARRTGPGRREERIDLPAAIDAAAAQAFVQTALAARGVARQQAAISLPWRYLGIRPGDSLLLDATGWRVRDVRFEAMAIRLALERGPTVAVLSAAAEPGRAISERDAVHGPTVLRVIDLPSRADAPASVPLLGVFAAGTSTGWRRAALLASVDGGATFGPVGSTALPATMGTTLTMLAPGPATIADRVHSIDIVLLTAAMTLSDADNAALLAGANLAMIGDEILQFGRATPLSPGVWQLSDLWRGRRGTDDRNAPHSPGNPFTILDPATFVTLPQAYSVQGVRVMASGLGDAPPYPETVCATASTAVAPLSPVAPRIVRLASGDTEIGWTRRSRSGAWRDGVDVPLAEEREAYRVTWPSGSAEVAVPAFLYTTAMRAADSAGGATVATISICQVGASALSRQLVLSVDLL